LSLPGFNGTLAEMPLVDLLQTLEVGKKNAIITLTRENVEGKVYITEGQVADAVLGNIDPQRALLRMFTWNEGTFSVSITKHDRPPGDFLPTSDLISEGITRLYRWEQLSKALPSLKSVVLTVPGIGEAKLTADERKVVALLNGPKRFIDVIEESRFDEIKTLRLLKGLYDKGLIIESPNEDNEITEDYLEKHRAHAQNGSTAAQTLEGIFLTLLRKPDSPRLNSNDGPHVERRRIERRRYDRRRNVNPGRSKIYLNKSELLILREKLLSQIKEQGE